MKKVGAKTIGKRALGFVFLFTVGAFAFFIAQFIFIGNMLGCMFGKRGKVPARVWEGAHGLEWTVPSPAPYHTFEDPPVVSESEITAVHDAHGAAPAKAH